jgi:uncharacterized protein (TIGR02145 family)
MMNQYDYLHFALDFSIFGISLRHHSGLVHSLNSHTMKRTLITSALVMVQIVIAIGQASITLTFTALFGGSHHPIDSIYVMNLNRGGSTTLTGGDTVLLLEEWTAVPGEISRVKELHLLQNYPNPFTAETTVSFFLPKEERLTISVFDLYGRVHLKQSGVYRPGLHQFAFFPGMEHCYLFSAESRTLRQVIKMVHSGTSGSGSCRLEYKGVTSEESTSKQAMLPLIPWVPGDTLRMVAYGNAGAGIILHDVRDDAPTLSKLYTMQFFQGLPCVGYPVVYDKNGNAYSTVRIGSKCWTRENLRATKTFSHTNNNIPLVTSATTWGAATGAARCWYNNDSAAYAAFYGALYNYRAGSLPRLCPDGWDQPTNDDYMEMISTLGGVTMAGGMLKSAGTLYWNSPNTGATNISGFSALPGGIRDGSTGGFASMGNIGAFWTSTSHSTTEGNTIGVFHNAVFVLTAVNNKNFGYSVRCIHDLSPEADFMAGTTTPYLMDTVLFTDLSSGNPVSWLWDFGDGTTSTMQHPKKIYLAPGSYTVKLIVTNPYNQDTLIKAVYINTIKIPDIDGNQYDGVRIGSQYWLRQNLRTTRLYDGSMIPLAAGATAWANATVPVRCFFNNDSVSYAQIYGALYNWKAVESTKLCPAGWHVPSDMEFQAMEMYLGMSSADANSIGFRGTDEGGKLKQAGTSHWSSPNTGATNASGFTGLPGGSRFTTGTYSSSVGESAGNWSSTPDGVQAWHRVLNHDDSKVYRGKVNKETGQYVRCLKN